MKLFQNKAERFYFFLFILVSVAFAALVLSEQKNIIESKKAIIALLLSLPISVVVPLVLIRPDFSRYSYENSLGLPFGVGAIQGFLYPLIWGLMVSVYDHPTGTFFKDLIGGLMFGLFMIAYFSILFYLVAFIIVFILNVYVVSFLTWKFNPHNEGRSSLKPLFLAAVILLVGGLAFYARRYENKDPASLAIFATAIFLPLLIIAGLGLIEAVRKWRTRKSFLNVMSAALFAVATCFTAYCVIESSVDRHQKAIAAQGLEAAKRIQERTNRDNQIKAENKELAERVRVDIAPPWPIAQKPKLQTVYRFHHPAGNWFYAHKPDGQPEEYRYEGPIFRLSAVPTDTSEAIYVCGHAPDFYLGTSVCAQKVMALGYPSRTKTHWAPFFVWSCYGGGGQILSINRNDCEGKTNISPLGFVGSASEGNDIQFMKPLN